MNQPATSATTTTAATIPAIELRDVAVTSAQNLSATIAENVNWTVNPGEFWLIGGPQGTGKSDIINMLGGLIPPAEGDYRFFGEMMPIFEEERLTHRLRLGLVFENGHLFERMTVAENVALPLRYHHNQSRKDVASEIAELLELCELTSLASNIPGTLPRNWRKRAGLARALAMQPEVLLLNDPLTALDARHAYWWVNFLGRLARGKTALTSKPMTIIVATTDLSPATGWRTRANRVACLIQRKLVVFQDWAELERSSEPVVRDLLNANPVND